MNGSHNKTTAPLDARRRDMLHLLGGGLAVALQGCCSLRPFPKALIAPEVLDRTEPAILASRCPAGTPSALVSCIDVHAHFFNASDVTVQGYLAGPVAHSMGGIQGELLRALAPLADELAQIAPTAKQEHDALNEMGRHFTEKAGDPGPKYFDDQIRKHRTAQSKTFYDLLKTPRGRDFVAAYGRSQSERRARGALSGSNDIMQLDENSLARAMELGEAPVDDASTARRRPIEANDYSEGVLAFVGYMLDYRWANLLTYRKVFECGQNEVRVTRVLGALVDFDRWLECPPRSAHEDQVLLHERLSRMSNGYMRPLIAYNPWTDVVQQGAARHRVREAMARGTCVGVKIYPPNGFRPWGNTRAQDRPGRPSHADINAALKSFWEMCIDMAIPVMAHTGQSMGKDDAHDVLGGPAGWEALLMAQEGTGRLPRVNLGHFGGDEPRNSWTSEMARLMGHPSAQHIFADLGFWTELRCGASAGKPCAGEGRLQAALQTRLSNGGQVADRVMFGTDWLMLSRTSDWSGYLTDLYRTITRIAPQSVEKIFSRNALSCFAPRLNS